MSDSVHNDSSQLILKIEGVAKNEEGQELLLWPRRSVPVDIARELLQNGFTPFGITNTGALEGQLGTIQKRDPKLYLLDTTQPTKTHPETIRVQYLALAARRKEEGVEALRHEAHAMRVASLWGPDAPSCNPNRGFHLDERREEHEFYFDIYPKSENKRRRQQLMQNYIIRSGLEIRKHRSWIGRNGDVHAMDLDDSKYFYGKIKPSQDAREPGKGLSCYHRSTRQPVTCRIV